MDNRFSDLERRFVSLKGDLDSCRSENITLSARIQSYENDFTKQGEENQNFRNMIVSLQSQLDVSKSHVNNLDSQVIHYANDLHEKTDECAYLTSLFTQQSQQVVDLQTRNGEYQVELARLMSDSFPSAIRLDSLEQELRLTLDYKQQLETEVESKSLKIIELQKSHSGAMRDIQKSLNERTADLNDLRDKYDQSQSQLSQTNHTSSIQSESLRQSVLQHADEVKVLTDQVLSQKKLSDMYSKCMDDLKTRAVSLEALVESREGSMHAMTLQEESRISDLVRDYDRQLGLLKEESVKRLAMLEAQLAGLLSSSSVPGTTTGTTTGTSTTRRRATHDEEEEDESKTDLYGRIALMERDLSREKFERRKAELYLENVLKNIQAKAPAIAHQKREFNRVVQCCEVLSEKLEVSLTSRDDLSSELNDVIRERLVIASECEEMRCSVVDLSRQVQELLREQLGLSDNDNNNDDDHNNHHNQSEASSTISNHLVVFSDIQELQQKNQQLLAVVRRLTHESEMSPLDMRSRNEMKQLTAELDSLKDGRSQMEEMMQLLVQQRDHYKFLLNDNDHDDGTVVSAAASPQASFTLTTATPNKLYQPQSNDNNHINDLSDKLAKSEDERQQLLTMISRLEASDEHYRESYNKTCAELSALRSRAAKDEAEATFQSDKAKKLQESLSLVERDLMMTSRRKSELEVILLHHEKGIDDMTIETSGLNDLLRRCNQELSLARSDKEISNQARDRYKSQLESLKTEAEKQANLSLTLQRIESGLSSKTSQENERLLSDRERLQKMYDVVRNESTEMKLLSDQRCRVLDAQVSALSSKCDQSSKMIESAKAELDIARNALTVSLTRNLVLEAQVESSQKRSSSYPHTEEDEASERMIELETCRLEIDSLEAQLVDSNNHLSQFQRISKDFESQVSSLRQQLDGLGQELTTSRSDCNNLKEKLRSFESDKRHEVAGYLREIERLEAVVISMEDKTLLLIIQHDDAMNSEMTKVEIVSRQCQELTEQSCQAASNLARVNDDYDNELRKHVSSRTDLSNKIHELIVCKDSNSKLEAKLSLLTSEKIILERNMNLQSQAMEQLKCDLEVEMGAMRNQNDLLHDQVQKIGHRMSNEVESAVSSSSSSSDVSVQDMLELIKSLRRDRQVSDVKKEVSERERDRLLQVQEALCRSLDEVRSELRSHLESVASNIITNREHEQLMQQVKQISIYRESNDLLRQEKESLSHQVSKCANEVRSLEDRLAPVERDRLSLESERDSLSQEVAFVKKQLDDMRKRLVTVLDRFDAVDPEEHKEIVSQLNDAKAQVAHLEMSRGELTSTSDSLRNDLSVYKDEMLMMEQRLSTSEARIEKFRGYLRDSQQRNEALTKQLKDLQQEKSEVEKRLSDLSVPLVARSVTTSSSSPVMRSLSVDDMNASEQLSAVAAVTSTSMMPISSVSSPPKLVPIDMISTTQQQQIVEELDLSSSAPQKRGHDESSASSTSSSMDVHDPSHMSIVDVDSSSSMKKRPRRTESTTSREDVMKKMLAAVMAKSVTSAPSDTSSSSSVVIVPKSDIQHQVEEEEEVEVEHHQQAMQLSTKSTPVDTSTMLKTARPFTRLGESSSSSSGGGSNTLSTSSLTESATKRPNMTAAKQAKVKTKVAKKLIMADKQDVLLEEKGPSQRAAKKVISLGRTAAAASQAKSAISSPPLKAKQIGGEEVSVDVSRRRLRAARFSASGEEVLSQEDVKVGEESEEYVSGGSDASDSKDDRA